MRLRSDEIVDITSKVGNKVRQRDGVVSKLTKVDQLGLDALPRVANITIDRDDLRSTWGYSLHGNLLCSGESRYDIMEFIDVSAEVAKPKTVGVKKRKVKVRYILLDCDGYSSPEHCFTRFRSAIEFRNYVNKKQGSDTPYTVAKITYLKNKGVK